MLSASNQANPAGAAYKAPHPPASSRQKVGLSRAWRVPRLTAPACAAAVVRLWRVWYIGVVWLLAETSIYGVVLFGPILIEAALSGTFDSSAAGMLCPSNPTP